MHFQTSFSPLPRLRLKIPESQLRLIVPDSTFNMFNLSVKIHLNNTIEFHNLLHNLIEQIAPPPFYLITRIAAAEKIGPNVIADK